MATGWRSRAPIQPPAVPSFQNETQAVAKAYGAACHADYFLFDRERRLFYRGQMDGARPGNGVPVDRIGPAPGAHAVLGGGPSPEVQRPSLGCQHQVEARQRTRVLPSLTVRRPRNDRAEASLVFGLAPQQVRASQAPGAHG